MTLVGEQGVTEHREGGQFTTTDESIGSDSDPDTADTAAIDGGHPRVRIENDQGGDTDEQRDE